MLCAKIAPAAGTSNLFEQSALSLRPGSIPERRSHDFSSEFNAVVAMQHGTQANQIFITTLWRINELWQVASPDANTIHILEKLLYSLLSEDVPKQENLMRPLAELLVKSPSVRALFDQEPTLNKKELFYVEVSRVLSRRLPDTLQRIRFDFLKRHDHLLNVSHVHQVIAGKQTLNTQELWRRTSHSEEVVLNKLFDEQVDVTIEALRKSVLRHRHHSKPLQEDTLLADILSMTRRWHGRYDVKEMKKGRLMLLQSA